MGSYAEELDMAVRVARRAGEAALAHAGCAFENKPDASPVTVADRETERLIATALEEAFPGDGLLGEEGAEKAGRSGRRWIIDPIDGTRDFVRGVPTWAVLVGLEDAGEVAAGCAYFPATDEMYAASRGGGAFLNGAPIHASAATAPAQSVLCINALNHVREFPWGARLMDWMAGFWAVRSFGGCRDAVMVAAGQADLWLGPSGKAWDFAALKIIAQEAGARFFDFSGADNIYGGSCVICAPGMEREARRFLGLR